MKPLYYFVAFLILVSILPVNSSHSAINNSHLVYIRLDYVLHGLVFVPFMWIARIKKIRIQSLELNHKGIALDTHFFLRTRFYLHCIAGLSVAVFCECIQYLLSYRTFNLNDLYANLSGVIIGIPFYFFLRSCRFRL